MSLKRRDFFSEINGANSTGNDSVKEGGDYSKVLPYTKNFTKDLEASTVENFTARILPRKTGADGEIDPQVREMTKK